MILGSCCMYRNVRRELLLARCGVSVLEGAVVLGLTLGDNPCPLVAIVRSDSGYVGFEEATAIGPCLTYDGVAPTLVVEPVEVFAVCTLDGSIAYHMAIGIKQSLIVLIKYVEALVSHFNGTLMKPNF